MGFYYMIAGEQAQMVSAAERAVQLNPSYAPAYESLAEALALAARTDEAIEYAERAQRLNPKRVGLSSLNAMTWAHFAAGRYQTAAEWAQRTADRFPNYEVGYRGLAASYGQLGRLEEARVYAQKTLEAHPDFSLDQRKLMLPDKFVRDSEHFVEGLRKAGLN